MELVMTRRFMMAKSDQKTTVSKIHDGNSGRISWGLPVVKGVRNQVAQSMCIKQLYIHKIMIQLICCCSLLHLLNPSRYYKSIEIQVHPSNKPICTNYSAPEHLAVQVCTHCCKVLRMLFSPKEPSLLTFQSRN